MAPIDPTRRRAANAAALVVCVLALWWAFVVGERVPLLSYVDLGFHELGHLLFAWAPGATPALAGSIMQVGVPLGFALYFAFARHETYATALMLAWTGTAAQNVSVYVVDAPFRVLPLLGNGQRDWAFIFSSLGHVEWATPAAQAVILFGLVSALAGAGLAAYALLVRPRVRVPVGMGEEGRLAALPRHEPRNRPTGAAPFSGDIRRRP
jgi:hypothetical protein